MADINCVTLTGRLTRDGELRYSPNGGAIVRFSLAVNRSKRNADGTWGEDTSFFDCVYFGKAAEATNSYLTKGRMIAINGELRQNRWEGSDGQSRNRVEIYVNQLTLTQGASRGEGSAVADSVVQRNSSPTAQSSSSYNNNYNSENRSSQQRPVLTNGPEDFQDDDIPF